MSDEPPGFDCRLATFSRDLDLVQRAIDECPDLRLFLLQEGGAHILCRYGSAGLEPFWQTLQQLKQERARTAPVNLPSGSDQSP